MIPKAALPLIFYTTWGSHFRKMTPDSGQGNRSSRILAFD